MNVVDFESMTLIPSQLVERLLHSGGVAGDLLSIPECNIIKEISFFFNNLYFLEMSLKKIFKGQYSLPLK